MNQQAEQPKDTWKWLYSFMPGTQNPAPLQTGTVGSTDGVTGGRKRRSKTRRGGKKSRKSKPLKSRRK